ncbi:5-oxoprolinase subunit PxpB [Muricauda sp. JGD-17]|uniref:5-oxoprolinase subunit PxpB n=1 Tax=Flagellimonas ochracea TaxID=2696472 RepID=A0A964TB80_9FLAO|nr:5-oxoprolinase subunit PxpB [Allomuricauda ochracea]NAY90828.1 5-oxoprolinase subunit PxpB [Allomuricauda ochracea]
MKSYPINIKPFGEYAVLLEWPNRVEEDILYDILGFVEHFKATNASDWETVVAYNSLTLINNRGLIDFDTAKEEIEQYLATRDMSKTKVKSYLWEIPVCYDLEFGIDLEEVAKRLNLSTDELVNQHTSYQYTVYGIGFLPGFMYLGGLPSSLEVPRRAEPRLKVAKGSVGLAGKQTGIYPQQSPGGWNIIGNCPISLFNPEKEKPCMVSVGDKVQFLRIEKAEYDLHKIEAEVGIYQLKKTPLNG